MSYDYEAKARADFATGQKDERLYAITEKHGEDYRRGWRLARLADEARRDEIDSPPPAPPAPTKPEPQPAAPNPQLDLFS